MATLTATPKTRTTRAKSKTRSNAPVRREPVTSMDRALEDIRMGRVYGPFDTVEEAMASMLADDD